MTLLADKRAVCTLADVITLVNVAKLEKVIVFSGGYVVICGCNNVIMFNFGNSF